jgi:hypothetical protein
LSEIKRSSTPGGGYSTSVAPPLLSSSSSNASARDKELPLPPISSTQILKPSSDAPRAHAVRPTSVRPRSYTQAADAGQMILQSSQMGNEPSSGLDRIIAGAEHVQHASTPIQGLPQRSSTYGPTADISHPVSILQNPHPYIPPVSRPPAPRTPSRSDTAPAAPAMVPVSSSSQDFGIGPSGSRGRDVSGLSAIHEGGSRNSRKSRRSMSMSDANEEIRVSLWSLISNLES